MDKPINQALIYHVQVSAKLFSLTKMFTVFVFDMPPIKKKYHFSLKTLPICFHEDLLDQKETDC